MAVVLNSSELGNLEVTVFVSSEHNYEESIEECENLGKSFTLASWSFRDIEELISIRETVGQEKLESNENIRFFVGVRDKTDLFDGLNNDLNRFEMEDDSKEGWISLNEVAGEFPWVIGEPNNFNGVQNCIAIVQTLTVGFLDDTICENNFNFVCTRRIETKIETKTDLFINSFVVIKIILIVCCLVFLSCLVYLQKLKLNQLFKVKEQLKTLTEL